jgi:hypothetical protein
MQLIDTVAPEQAVIGIMIVVLIFRGWMMNLFGWNFLPVPPRYVIALRCPTSDAQIIILTQADQAIKQFKTRGWKFYPKMDQILPSGSNAHGAAAYNPASLAAEVLVGGAGTSNMAADGSFSWSQCASALPVTSPAPVAGPSSASTMSMDTASLSLTSSTGKRSHSDMVTSHSVPPSIISNSFSKSQIAASESDVDVKKSKLSARTTASGSSISKSRANPSKKKEVVTAAAWMNIQSSINRFTDVITMSMATEESRVADESSRALEEMQKEDLSADEKILLLNAFLQNTRICGVYLNTVPELRLGFLRSIIDQVKGNPL